jgi:hypothetical protein
VERTSHRNAATSLRGVLEVAASIYPAELWRWQPDQEHGMHFGPKISASVLYGLGWILLGCSAVMAVLAIFVFADFVTLPISVRTDLIGAAACAVLGLLSRLMARRFEAGAYPG